MRTRRCDHLHCAAASKPGRHRGLWFAGKAVERAQDVVQPHASRCRAAGRLSSAGRCSCKRAWPIRARGAKGECRPRACRARCRTSEMVRAALQGCSRIRSCCLPGHTTQRGRLCGRMSSSTLRKAGPGWVLAPAKIATLLKRIAMPVQRQSLGGRQSLPRTSRGLTGLTQAFSQGSSAPLLRSTTLP